MRTVAELFTMLRSQQHAVREQMKADQRGFEQRAELAVETRAEDVRRDWATVVEQRPDLCAFTRDQVCS